MRMKTHLIVLLVALGCARATFAEDPLIVYERTHSLVAHEDNTYSLVVYQDGRAEAHFPRHSPDAGSYQWSLSPEAVQNLLELAAPLADVDSRRLLAGIQDSRSQGLIEVADADRVVLEINDATRGRNEIVVPSPEIWQKQLPDGNGMATVATIATELAAWMREQANQAEERAQ